MIAVVIGAVAVLVVSAVVWKAAWRTPAPDEALIVSGPGATTGGPGFKIVETRGTLVLPGYQTCRRFPLGPWTVTLDLGCVASDGTDVRVRGEMTYRVGDGPTSIGAAARRFLGQEELMEGKVREILTGRLPSVADDLPAGYVDRNRFAERLRDAAAGSMGRMGLVAESVRIERVITKNP